MSRLERERLLERVRTDGDESSAHALLDAFFSGFPVERLREVLNSESEDAVRAGAWLASELGSKVAPLIADLALLLDHPSRYVRFFALDGVLMGATERDGATIAKAVELVDDRESAIRWKATNLLGRASTQQLSASVPYLRGDVRALAERLVLLETEPGDQCVRDLLQGDSEGERRLGLIASLRRSKRDPSLLSVAAKSEYPDVHEIAREWLGSVLGEKPNP